MVKKLSFTSLLLTVAILAGCSTFKPKLADLNPLLNADKEKLEESELPARMAIMWKDAVIHGVGSTPTAGFGGRVFFYNTDDEAVMAEGELTIYGYDDENKSTAANHKYVFRQEEFQNHYDDSGLGHSYGVWIPWQKMGGQRKSVSLIPVFKTADGRLIRGGQSLVVLPGTAPKEQLLAKTDITAWPASRRNNANQMPPSRSGVILASAESEIEGDSRTQNIKTATISVPKDLARRMSQLPVQSNSNRPGRSNELQTLIQRMPGPATHGQPTETDSNNLETLNQPPNMFDAPISQTTNQRPVFGQPGTFR